MKEGILRLYPPVWTGDPPRIHLFSARLLSCCHGVSPSDGGGTRRGRPSHGESGESNFVQSSPAGLMRGDRARQSEPPPVCMTAPGWQAAPLLMS